MQLSRFSCLFIVAALSIAAYAQGDGSRNCNIRRDVFTSFADFCGARIASGTGSVFAQYVDKVIPNVEHRYYNHFSEVTAALLADRVDAITLDMPIAMYLVAQNPALAIFPYVVAEDSFGFAVAKGSKLGVRGNKVLEKFKEGDLICELEKFWFAADESKKKMPKLKHRRDFDGSAGTIRYGFEAARIPMSYLSAKGEPLGFDLDLARRIAYEMNMKIEFIPMPFDALFPALASGKIDMAGGCLSITAERRKKMDFIGPYFEGGTTLVIKKERMGTWKDQ
jgi:polar amino acid transport system substrate-binding protein